MKLRDAARTAAQEELDRLRAKLADDCRAVESELLGRMRAAAAAPWPQAGRLHYPHAIEATAHEVPPCG